MRKDFQKCSDCHLQILPAMTWFLNTACMKAPPEPSLVPYNNIHQGILLMLGLNPLLLNAPDPGLAERAQINVPGSCCSERRLQPSASIRKVLIAPTRSERLPQNWHQPRLQMLSQGEPHACQTISSRGTKKAESLLQFIFNQREGSLRSSFGNILSCSILDICILTARHRFLLCKGRGGKSTACPKLCKLRRDACTAWTNVWSNQRRELMYYGWEREFSGFCKKESPAFGILLAAWHHMALPC